METDSRADALNTLNSPQRVYFRERCSGLSDCGTHSHNIPEKEDFVEKSHTYIIRRLVLFSDQTGFILSKDLSSHNIYVTLQFSQVFGKICCYPGTALVTKQDFRRQVSDYQQKHNVRITKIYGLNINRPYHH